MGRRRALRARLAWGLQHLRRVRMGREWRRQQWIIVHAQRREAATRTLQRVVRGHLGRRRAQRTRLATGVRWLHTRWCARAAARERAVTRAAARRTAAAGALQAWHWRLQGRAWRRTMWARVRAERAVAAAVTVQRVGRGWAGRRSAARVRLARDLQRLARGKLGRRAAATAAASRREAAAVVLVQCAVRRFLAVRAVAGTRLVRGVRGLRQRRAEVLGRRREAAARAFNRRDAAARVLQRWYLALHADALARRAAAAQAAQAAEDAAVGIQSAARG